MQFLENSVKIFTDKMQEELRY